MDADDGRRVANGLTHFPRRPRGLQVGHLYGPVIDPRSITAFRSINPSFRLQIVVGLGIVIFSALDMGYSYAEERAISRDLENLIDLMTSEGK